VPDPRLRWTRRSPEGRGSLRRIACSHCRERRGEGLGSAAKGRYAITMAKNSSIEWTHHTFNPWWGCVHVSPGCNNCYAEAWARRVGWNIWHARGERRFFSDAHWRQPVQWNLAAAKLGVRYRVFCASMADVFEWRADLTPWRLRLWDLIHKTPSLDWLLLTKRPQNIARLAPWRTSWPHNVWLGTTAENQRFAEKRIARLLEHRAAIHFISAEPLLGPLSLERWLEPARAGAGKPGINWVIAGGESGPRARPMDPLWATSLRDQCSAAGIPFHFKQWGHWAPAPTAEAPASRVWIFRSELDSNSRRVVAVGKKHAGRSLDGTTWDAVPLRKASDGAQSTGC
jgi:protein gp37